jgi:small GTP-binding protein
MVSHIDIQHKIVFLGDSNTGKSSIILKYLKLAQQSYPTIAASTYPMTVTVQDTPVHLSCWDTAGQESYRCLVPMYARDAEVACLVFDQSNPSSFDSLDRWLSYIRNEIGIRNIIVVSNKSDLEPAVPIEKALDFCGERHLPLVETSALTGSNLSFLFVKIAEMIYESLSDRLQIDSALQLKAPEQEKERCC